MIGPFGFVHWAWGRYDMRKMTRINLLIRKKKLRNGKRKEKNIFTVPVPVGRIRFKEKLSGDDKNEFTYMKNLKNHLY